MSVGPVGGDGTPEGGRDRADTGFVDYRSVGYWQDGCPIVPTWGQLIQTRSCSRRELLSGVDHGHQLLEPIEDNRQFRPMLCACGE